MTDRSDGALSGVVALVAGGASGLGRGVVERFLAEGASMAVFDRDRDRLDEFKRDHGADVLTVHGDITDLDDQGRCMSETGARFGRIDALVVTTGIVDYVDGYRAYDLTQLEAAFNEVMAVNVRGPISLTLAALPSLAVSANASVTFTSSTSAMRVPASGPVYGLAKAALSHSVQQLALEFAPHVRVNAVVPGAVLDSAIRGPDALGQSTTRSRRLSASDAAAVVAASNLVGWAPTGSDYAGLYALLASHAGRVCTGAVIPWDTGLLVLGHGAGAPGPASGSKIAEGPVATKRTVLTD